MTTHENPHFETLVDKSREQRFAEAVLALTLHEDKMKAETKAAEKKAMEAEHAKLVRALAPQIAAHLHETSRPALQTRIIKYEDFGPYSKHMNAGKTKRAQRYLDEHTAEAWPMDFIVPLPGTAAMPTSYRNLLLGTNGQIYESRNTIDPRNMRNVYVAAPYDFEQSPTPAAEGLANMAFGYNLVEGLELHEG